MNPDTLEADKEIAREAAVYLKEIGHLRFNDSAQVVEKVIVTALHKSRTGDAAKDTEDTRILDWLADRCYFPDDHPSDTICVIVPESASPQGSFTCNPTNDRQMLRKAASAAMLKQDAKGEGKV
jgi:hypothetical protein